MSSVFVPPHIRGNKAPVTQASIQKLLDENSHLIQCIVDNQSNGKMRECAQYQQILHRNLVWLATVADSNQSNAQNLLGQTSPKQGGGATSQIPKLLKSDAQTLSAPASQPMTTTSSPNQTPLKSLTPKPNGSNPPTPTPAYTSPQGQRSSPLAKPSFNQQQNAYQAQYRRSPNSTGNRTPMRSPPDPVQAHTSVQRQSPLAASSMTPQYSQHQTMPANMPQRDLNQAAGSFASQPPVSFTQPQGSYAGGQQPASYAQPPASAYSQQGPYPQPSPASYSQSMASYPQQQQPSSYASQPGSYPTNQTVPQASYPQGAPSQPQYHAPSNHGMMPGQPRPYYGRPGPAPSSGGYQGYSGPPGQQMPPPGQQMSPYHQTQQSPNYPPQYGSQTQQNPHYGQPPPQQQMPYQQ